jgi:hypothetical protein
MAKVRLHRCPFLWLKTEGHGCWQAQKALEEQRIAYELVKVPTLPRSRRTDVLRLTGQALVPVIEFEDGAALREDSEDMAARIRAGKLFEGRGSEPPA